MTENKISVSGIYLDLAAWNHGAAPEDMKRPDPECGIGAVVSWAGKLWFITYTSHALGAGHDKLYSVSPDMTREIHPESVGGTHANRIIHRESIFRMLRD